MLFTFVALVSLSSGTTAALRPHYQRTTAPADRASPAPKGPQTDAQIVARARAFYDEIASGTIDRRTLTAEFSAQLTPAVVATFASALAGLGKPSAFALREKHDVDGVSTYDFAVSTPNGGITVTFGIDDAADRIARFYVRRGNGDVR